LHKIGFNGDKHTIIELLLAIFTTITALENKLLQKQCDLTRNIYSYLGDNRIVFEDLPTYIGGCMSQFKFGLRRVCGAGQTAICGI